MFHNRKLQRYYERLDGIRTRLFDHPLAHQVEEAITAVLGVIEATDEEMETLRNQCFGLGTYIAENVDTQIPVPFHLLPPSPLNDDTYYVGSTAWSGLPDGPFYSAAEAEAYAAKYPDTFLIPANQVDPDLRRELERSAALQQEFDHDLTEATAAAHDRMVSDAEEADTYRWETSPETND